MSTTETIAPTGTWALDPVHSLVGFEVSYMAGTFRGQFRDVSVSLAIGDDGNAALEGVANVASVDVKDENLDAHLQSPDFFDSENFPELRFAAQDVALEGDHVTANGEITIKGVTKPVTVTGTASAPMEDPWGNQRFGLTLSAEVDRTDFDLRWNNPLPSGDAALANEVRIVAELQLVKAV
jgi:polyisoprenoid-binding protein YceI